MSITTKAAGCLLAAVLCVAGEAQTHRFPHIDIVNTLPSGPCAPANNLVQYLGNIYICDPGTLTWRLPLAQGGGAGNPAGSPFAQQYNAAGLFGGSTATDDGNGNQTSTSLVSGAVNGIIDYGAKLSGNDIGPALNACIATLSSATGGVCSGASLNGRTNLTIATEIVAAQPNITIILPCATIASSLATAMSIGAASHNTSILSACGVPGDGTGGVLSGGTYINWSGATAGPFISVGADGTNTVGFKMHDITLQDSGTGSGAVFLRINQTQGVDLDDLHINGSNSANTQTLVYLDGGSNYTGGVLSRSHLSGGLVEVYGTGSTSTSGANAFVFRDNHYNPLAIAGARSIYLDTSDGDLITGGDVENNSTAGQIELGPNAQHTTISGARFEGTTNQVLIDLGSAYTSISGASVLCQTGVVNNGSSNFKCDDPFGQHSNYNGYTIRNTAESGSTLSIQGGAASYQQLRLLFLQGKDAGNYWQIESGTADELSFKYSVPGTYGSFVLATTSSLMNFTNASIDYGTLQITNNGPQIISPQTNKIYLLNNVDAELDTIHKAGLTTNQNNYNFWEGFNGAIFWKQGVDANNANAYRILDAQNGNAGRLEIDPGGNTYLDAFGTGNVAFGRFGGSGTAVFYAGNSSTVNAEITSAGGLFLKGATPSGAGFLGLGNTTVAGSFCGSTGPTGCLQISLSGTTYYIPFWASGSPASISYSTPTTTAIPKVTNTTGPVLGNSALTDNGLSVSSSEPIAAPSLTLSGTPTLGIASTLNNDITGRITLSAGTGTYSFAGTFANAPNCVASDNTALNPVEVATTNTTLTVTGTGTDVITYICVSRQ